MILDIEVSCADSDGISEGYRSDESKPALCSSAGMWLIGRKISLSWASSNRESVSGHIFPTEMPECGMCSVLQSDCYSLQPLLSNHQILILEMDCDMMHMRR